MDKEDKFEQWHRKNFDSFNGGSYRFEGWTGCKREILNILRKPIQNLDLSWEECDQRFIDKIEKEL